MHTPGMSASRDWIIKLFQELSSSLPDEKNRYTDALSLAKIGVRQRGAGWCNGTPYGLAFSAMLCSSSSGLTRHFMQAQVRNGFFAKRKFSLRGQECILLFHEISI